MCGIVGLDRSYADQRGWRPDVLVDRALTALAWRGRDGAGVRAAGTWLLGCARLAISDPVPAADQPIAAGDGADAACAVLNGAVTSARTLWAKVPSARTRNDAELVLALAQDAAGATALPVTGAHAWAVVDPARAVLRLGRDPAGEKPLFVVADTSGTCERIVAFASTPAALRALGFDLVLADAARAQLLAFGWCEPRLHVADRPELRVRSDLHGGLEQRDGAGPARSVALDRWTDDAFPDERDLATALAGAVDRCSTSDVPVGLALSGGIDSGCIAVLVDRREHGPASVLAYQGAARGEPGAERELAHAIAGTCPRVRLREVDFGPEMLAVLPELTRDVGLPLGDPSVLAVHAVARAARADGVRVLLSGEGSDELLLGYRRHRLAARLPVRGPSWSTPAAAAARTAVGLGHGTLARGLRAALAERSYDELLRVSPTAFVAAVRPDLARPGTLPDGPVGESGLARARRLDRSHYLRFDLLPKLDTATLAAGVEGRCPFLDPSVVRHADQLAGEPRAVLGKRPLRRAFADRLPAAVFRARKRGFAVPVDRWLREDDMLPDLLRERRTLERGGVDAAALRRMLDDHRAGRVALGHGLYAVAALELYERSREVSA